MDFQRIGFPVNRTGVALWMRYGRLLCLLFLLFVPMLVAGCGEGPVEEPDRPQNDPPPAVSLSATGKVLDGTSGQPIPNALVTLDRHEVIHADQNGQFPLKKGWTHVAARAIGHTRADRVSDPAKPEAPVELKLNPVSPKALYLTVYGIGSKVIRNRALDLVDGTELNALVIDVKGDRGFIPYPSTIPLAGDIGGQKIRLVKDMKDMVQTLKARGVYTIARIVVFKDDLLGKARPSLAVKKPDGSLFKDREELVWVDASRKEVWDYNIDIAIEAASFGFDEIQFDYVRFPDHKGLVFSVPNTEENRVKHITGFLAEARKRLEPYNVFIAADIFGYVVWNQNDTHIGQKIDHLDMVDYICLMLYPSGFHLGIPKYRNPVVNSNRIVYLSLKKAQERSGLPPVRFRPWLQSFRDYAFDRRFFDGHEIREQIKASEEFGSNGWMLWNPRNAYKADGLAKESHSRPKEAERAVVR